MMDPAMIMERLTANPALFAMIAALLGMSIAAATFAYQRQQAAEARLKRIVAIGRSGGDVSRNGRGGGLGGGGANDLVEERLKRAEEQAREKRRKGAKAGTATTNTRDLLAMSGLPITIAQYYKLSVIGALVVTLLSFLAGLPLAVAALMPLVGGLGLPRFILRFIVGQRRQAFMRDLPDALESMVRGLRAGLPISEAIAMISREYEGPIATEFRLVTERQQAGFTLSETLELTAERISVAEVRMLSICIGIQAQAGGSLGETISNLSEMIRGRIRLKRKVSAITSEAKSSAGIIGSLPFLISGAIAAISPDYMTPLFETKLGNVLLVGGLLWMCIGIVVMIRMINFKV